MLNEILTSVDKCGKNKNYVKWLLKTIDKNKIMVYNNHRMKKGELLYAIKKIFRIRKMV